MKYTINWRKVINAYDKVSLGRLTQTRIAEIYGVSGACITDAQNKPFSELRLNRFRKLHDLYFKEFIEFDNIYTKVDDNKRS
tara:strand:- start:80 stop:325 length:246 start_codon:yes stop_codon:yes gene_type:complete